MAMFSRRHSQLPRGQSSKDLVARVFPAFLVGAILCAHEVCQLWSFAKLSPCENHRNTMITYTTASCALFNTGFRVTPATCPRNKLHPSCSHTHTHTMRPVVQAFGHHRTFENTSQANLGSANHRLSRSLPPLFWPFLRAFASKTRCQSGVIRH